MSQFLTWWLLSSAIGWPLGFAVGYPFDTPELLPLGGVIPAGAAAILLARANRDRSWLRRWGWAFPAGWLVGTLAMLPWPWPSYDESQLEAGTFGLLLPTLLLVGLLQTVALRRLGQAPWGSVFLPLLALLGAGVAGTGLSASLVQNRLGLQPVSNSEWILVHFVGFAGFGLIFGVITALGMMRMGLLPSRVRGPSLPQVS